MNRQYQRSELQSSIVRAHNASDLQNERWSNDQLAPRYDPATLPYVDKRSMQHVKCMQSY